MTYVPRTRKEIEKDGGKALLVGFRRDRDAWDEALAEQLRLEDAVRLAVQANLPLTWAAFYRQCFGGRMP